MKANQASHREKKLEEALRKYGIEGEAAFYLIASRYLIHFSDVILNPPEQIRKRGTRVISKIANELHLLKTIDTIVSNDSKGQYLPRFYQHFIGRRFREGSGKFFTPHSIARAMASLIPCKEDVVVMDPTCGGGTLLTEASNRLGDFNCHLVANDVEQSLVDLTRTVLSLNCPGNHTISYLHSNIFSLNLELREWFGKVDYILANPPFSLQIDNISFGSRLYDLGYRNSDALFLDICFKLLHEEGRLVCILPHSIIANSEYERLRHAVEESWNLRGVIGMPEGVFYIPAKSTTRADIIVLEKQGVQGERIEKTVFAFAPSVGVPLKSRTRSQASNALEQIVNAPSVMKALGTDER